VAPHPLRQRRRPDFEAGERSLSIVDLFAGCGGLTLGAAQAARAKNLAADVRLAVDFDEAPLRVYRANFPAAKVRVASVQEVLDAEVGDGLTSTERATRREVGNLDLLLGGPPCQGHSDLNNHTRRADPKNRLYLTMARAAEVLRPRAVLVENVPAVVHDSEGVVQQTKDQLQALGYFVADKVVELISLDVPQRRRRHILVAVKPGGSVGAKVPSEALAPGGGAKRDLKWAIGDLEGIVAKRWTDTPSRPSRENQERMIWLLKHGEYDLPNARRPPCHQGDHSYVSMYGRLRWDQPAQTITSGFGSMGQGRFMHPSQPRTLTPHEAARIQGFPDYFSFDAARNRTELAVTIGNAVPPALARTVVRRLIAAGAFS
jgi:DNA (cytosine-5)-methyltransferase 1